MAETATANNPTDASALTDASATQTATAASTTDNTQQTQPAQTQTPTGTETTADGTQNTETATVSGAPEKYTFTAPEGTEYDSGILDAYTGAAREANLTQDVAQKLIEKMAPAIAARQSDQIKAIHEGWKTASTADKEFGGEKLKENLGIAKRAIDTFDPLPASAKVVDGKPVGADGKPLTTPLRTLLDQTGLGNHPEILRLLFRAGKAISEDGFVTGRATGNSAPNPANVLYDKTSKG